MNNVEKQTNIV